MKSFAFSSGLDPFDGLLRLQQELQRAFDRPVERWGWGRSARGVFPPVNVFRKRDSYVVRLEVPGLSAENLNVETEGNTLTVSGKRDTGAVATESVHRRDRWAGEFSRSLHLPDDLDLEAATASYERGIVTIRVPRSEASKPRRIEIQGSEKERT